MKKILVLSDHGDIASTVMQSLVKEAEVELRVWESEPREPITGVTYYGGDAHVAADYVEAVRNVAVIYSDLTGMDVDWAIEAVTEAIRETNNQAVRFVFRSVAGIDEEVTEEISYPGITDKSAFLKQQRYAIKMIDEEEIPYTILRVSNVSATSYGKLALYNEGNAMPSGNVSRETLSQFIVQELLTGEHTNQSIGLVEKEG
ncbi:saccharopine dehydrogenase [Secundilactobacillus oryzae JCM 18671]|uniref:Saccharopine dehydrogenase n=1 Tax=Secundilactobacillus oryzae JCM 18671 TaxID=1291743 RepID=A0A081BHF9_9LACO|nr:NAD(P)H-binding protein [Secundilactobacillus oryzae]GAK47477.1 saccharopine dehydrogenase [Secundilactobacillus oryzae JCM 18671]